MSPEHPLNTAILPPPAEDSEPAREAAVEVATLDPLEGVEVATMNPAQIVSTYADTLMGGLFGDLERLLDGDEAALATVEADLKRATNPPYAAPPSPQVDVAPDPAPTAESTESATALATLVDAATSPAPTAPAKTALGQWLDRLLLACTAFSLAGVVAFLWLGQRPQDSLSSEAAADSAATAAQSDAEFLAYLQRSLDTIVDQVAAAQAEDPQSPDPWPNGALLPPVGFPSQRPDLDGPNRINVIERVYIPYQAAPPTLPSAPPTAAMPPADGSLATPPAPPSVETTPPLQPSAPVVSHVLIGVLELGDRSAALFEINGVPQRVAIGERIGNAGWSLVSVSNQEAVIRRNGEVRSVYIGQPF